MSAWAPMGRADAMTEKAAQGIGLDGSQVWFWLWLGGGPSHIETFDPKLEAPSEFRSTVGAVQSNVPGIELGGVFPRRREEVPRRREFAPRGEVGGKETVVGRGQVRFGRLRRAKQRDRIR